MVQVGIPTAYLITFKSPEWRKEKKRFEGLSVLFIVNFSKASTKKNVRLQWNPLTNKKNLWDSNRFLKKENENLSSIYWMTWKRNIQIERRNENAYLWNFVWENLCDWVIVIWYSYSLRIVFLLQSNRRRIRKTQTTTTKK